MAREKILLLRKKWASSVLYIRIYVMIDANNKLIRCSYCVNEYSGAFSITSPAIGNLYSE